MILVHRGLSGMLSHLSSSESTPPLYYVLVWAWTKVFGAGPIGFRSLSALAGTLTIPVMYAAGREISPRVGLWAAALAAFNPAMFYYSQEARAYALLILFARRRLRALAARAADSRSPTSGAVGGSIGAGAADALLRRVPVRGRGRDPRPPGRPAAGVGADRRRRAGRRRAAAAGRRSAGRREGQLDRRILAGQSHGGDLQAVPRRTLRPSRDPHRSARRRTGRRRSRAAAAPRRAARARAGTRRGDRSGGGRWRFRWCSRRVTPSTSSTGAT